MKKDWRRVNHFRHSSVFVIILQEERWQTVVICFISRRNNDEISELRGFFFTCHTWLFCVYLIGTSLLQQIIEGEYSVESKEGLGFYREMNCIHNKSDCWVPTMSLGLPMISCSRSWECDLEGVSVHCSFPSFTGHVPLPVFLSALPCIGGILSRVLELIGQWFDQAWQPLRT